MIAGAVRHDDERQLVSSDLAILRAAQDESELVGELAEVDIARRCGA
jgi:hypothetical protein